MVKVDFIGIVVDLLDNMVIMHNVNTVDSIDMVNMQKTFDYLLVETSGSTW